MRGSPPLPSGCCGRPLLRGHRHYHLGNYTINNIHITPVLSTASFAVHRYAGGPCLATAMRTSFSNRRTRHCGSSRSVPLARDPGLEEMLGWHRRTTVKDRASILNMPDLGLSSARPVHLLALEVCLKSSFRDFFEEQEGNVVLGPRPAHTCGGVSTVAGLSYGMTMPPPAVDQFSSFAATCAQAHAIVTHLGNP